MNQVQHFFKNAAGDNTMAYFDVQKIYRNGFFPPGKKWSKQNQ